MAEKIRNFTELNTWKEGHKLVLLIYKIVSTFPSKEQFVLASQILRAVISITSNIAEGFGRQGIKEKIQFYYMAQASLTEVQNQLIIAKDVNYITDRTFQIIWEQSKLVQRLISGLIRSIKSL
jgi:four helix bundle protein